jgi:hypothetical protein
LAAAKGETATTTSPSDLPVNEIGNRSLHARHSVALEESDSKFARAKVKDQLFVDYLLMEDLLTVQQHANAEHLLATAVSAGVYLKSPKMDSIITAYGEGAPDMYSSGLMRWSRSEKRIRKRWGDEGVKVVYDHVILDIWTRQQERIATLGEILE